MWGIFSSLDLIVFTNMALKEDGPLTKSAAVGLIYYAGNNLIISLTIFQKGTQMVFRAF